VTALLAPDRDSVADALSDASRKLDLGGTHRLVEPDETLERVRPLFGRLGITRVANVTGLDWLGLPVVAVYRPNARSLAVSQGKGVTLAAAKASGVMEAAELAHAERVDRPLRLASHADLRRSHAVVDVAGLPRGRGRAFHEHLQLLWIEGYDLVQHEHVWVPFELVGVDDTGPGLPGAGCFLSTSNGLASGNNLLEAISHGIGEVVERDATTLWQLRAPEEQRETHLDLSSVADPVTRNVLAHFDAAGIEVLAWDITSDVGIPAYAALAAEARSDPRRSLYTSMGMGCHPSRRVALLRALTEAAQSRLTLIAGSRDDVFRAEYEISQRRLEALDAYRELCDPNGGRPEVASRESTTFRDDVLWQVEQLAARGLDRVVVCDLSDPCLGLSVVRVVVPGLDGASSSPDYVPGPRARALVERAR
jgi:ribosomal protein S12 methylthiotransferase accessory factor